MLNWLVQPWSGQPVALHKRDPPLLPPPSQSYTDITYWTEDQARKQGTYGGGGGGSQPEIIMYSPYVSKHLTKCACKCCTVFHPYLRGLRISSFAEVKKRQRLTLSKRSRVLTCVWQCVSTEKNEVHNAQSKLGLPYAKLSPWNKFSSKQKHYPYQGSVSHQYRISGLVPQTSSRGETVGGVVQCWLFS